MNKYFLIFFSIFLISGVFASGLEIVGNSSFNIEKINDVNSNVVFSLRNTEAFSFYNITFENNTDIFFPKISILESNQNITVTAVINSNYDFEKDFKIKGTYFSDIGQSNEIHNLNVNFNDGVDLCQLTIISGDSVIFKNNVGDDVKLVNTQTGGEIATILENSSYTMHFSQQEYLYYHFLRRGFQFTQGCFLNVLGTSGYINNPDFDTNIHVDLDMLYSPTTIQATVVDNNYTMDFYSSQEGIFQIKNIGPNIAKNINIQGDWFSFSSNNFDLAPGYTKTISYEISPSITSTNDTNKNYEKQISIFGNFDTVYKNFSIFLNYNNIDSGNYTSKQSIGEIIAEYCLANPEISFCKEEVKIIIKNQSDNDFNVTYSQNQVNEMFEMIFNVMDDIEGTNAYLREEINNIYSSNNDSASEMSNIKNSVDTLKDDKNNSSTLVYFLIIMILFISLCSVISYIIYTKRKQNKLLKLRRM